MRQPGDARHFVAAADAHPVVERDIGDVAVRPDDDLHAVRERGRMHLVGTRNAGWRGAVLAAAAAAMLADAERQEQAGAALTNGSFDMPHLEMRVRNFNG